MECIQIESLKGTAAKFFSAAHGYARRAKLPGLEHRRQSSIERMFMCREKARNAIAEIRSLRGAKS